ncbi:MAG: dipicolinate synthase subunit B [Oscillospiraceae bacterium]|jgi:dipicolinate synthase subunit B|nr:dipicolinate synthase subunit B [Oscillospiraceae bacterium]
MSTPTIGFALSGSFCTFAKTIEAMRQLAARYTIQPILSEASYDSDTRFGEAADFRSQIEEICQRPILHTLVQVEPLGPKKLLDLLVIAPCTGNTIGKLANGIADSAVTFACKAHLRNGRPVVLGISTNDALTASAENIGRLLNRKLYYFVPFGQDSPTAKPYSMVADLSKLAETVDAALGGVQIQPLLLAT